MNDRLIVALDVPTTEQALNLVERLDHRVNFYKIGLELLPVGGTELAKELVRRGKRVFLDYKFHDIGRTVKAAVQAVGSIGVDFLSVHGNSSTVQAAVEGRQDGHLKILAVTVLTNMDADDVVAMGFPCEVDQLVEHRAKTALMLGCDGTVASATEARMIRQTCPDGLIVTPGIRPFGEVQQDDQKRAVDVVDAISAGADHVVVGRPIIQAADPVAAAEEIIGMINAN